MPTPVSSSFIHDIEQRVLAELYSKLGQDSTAYPSPPWLWLSYAGRSGGTGFLPAPKDGRPVVWMQYLAGGTNRSEIGGSPIATLAQENFNVFANISLTPDIMGCDRDQDTFRAASEAAADLLMRRIIKVLWQFQPSVTDALLGYKTNGQRITAWAFTPVGKGEWVIDYTIIVRYMVMVSD